MKTDLKLKAAIAFTKYSVMLLCCWPPSRAANNFQKIIFACAWWFQFISSLCLLFPLLASVYIDSDNPEIMTQSICLSCAVTQVSIKMIFGRIRRTKLQVIF